ncbi:PREDICTED: uncharacterized protein LOC106628476 [Pseudopodoces humilis]|uniref:uncharacterized protein LOC106628476 n=1 Tax=Pseudopodoces humilis TaxID=181119 RepID=UPI0006B6C8CF|nr:PREDICTED: uncharacterized protein LOC106628476 [Pseudopodoces humilis]
MCHHSWLPVWPRWDMDEAMSFLLPLLVLLVASTAVLLATCIWKERKRLRGRARGSRRSRATPEVPGSPPAEETPPHGPAAPGSPLYIPCGCGPGCTPCATAARELQDLVTPLWPGVSFPQDSEMWQLLWEDLGQLLERGHLPCCASSSCSCSFSSSGSLHPSRSLSGCCQTPDGEDPVDRSCCSLGAVGMRRKLSSLRMHVAKKNLEVKLRAQPVPVRRSQEQLVQREASLHSSESLPCSSSLSGSCQTVDSGEDATDSSPCSPESADISGTRSVLRMHVAKKSLEVKLGAQPAPVRSSQQRVAQQEVSWSRRRPIHSSHSTAVQPDRNTRCSESKILQRQRELEFPHLRGAPPSQMRLLLAAQILLRMLCCK